MSGVIPTEAFNRQLVETVRAELHRIRNQIIPGGQNFIQPTAFPLVKLNGALAAASADTDAKGSLPSTTASHIAYAVDQPNEDGTREVNSDYDVTVYNPSTDVSYESGDVGFPVLLGGIMTFVGLTSSSGSGGGNCCQVETDTADLPVTFQAKKSGARLLTSNCDGSDFKQFIVWFDSTGSDIHQRDRGYFEWNPSSSVRLVWDWERGYYYKDISSEITIYDDAGTDITGSLVRRAYVLEDPDTARLTIYISVYGYTDSADSQFVNGKTRAFHYVNAFRMGFGSFTRSNVYKLDGASYETDRDPGAFEICSKADSEDTSGDVQLSMEYTVDSETYTAANGTWTITYTLKVTVTNGLTEDVTVDYDPDDFFINVTDEFDAATSFGVTAAGSSTQTIATGTIIVPQANVPFAVNAQGNLTVTGDSSSDDHSGAVAVSFDVPEEDADTGGPAPPPP